MPELLRGKRVLVVFHRHVLRSLIMQLNGLSVAQLMKLTIATGRPLVYNLIINWVLFSITMLIGSPLSNMFSTKLNPPPDPLWPLR